MYEMKHDYESNYVDYYYRISRPTINSLVDLLVTCKNPAINFIIVQMEINQFSSFSVSS